ncbi:hypothetical protein BBP40_011329 [Aspergillus hancockii]|nr:hypothetical protein BBP40_011329 [Aspergillus hancockii]
MVPQSSQTVGELIIVHQRSRDSRRQARVHLAQTGIKKRTQQQRKRSNDGQSPTGPTAAVNPRIPAPVVLSGSSMVEYLISTNVFNDLSSTWGVSPAVCPGPANLSHSLSRASDALECIFRANLAFHWVDLNLWMTPEGRRDMKIAALSYRGQAIELARKELLRYDLAQSSDRDSVRLPVHQTNREMSFGIVLRLLQLDYRFARSDVQAHFAACRRLLRHQPVDYFPARQSPIDDLACVIRNPHLHHLMITFESFLEGSPSAPPRISPVTILWRSLTKKPASIASNIYRDVCESSAQLAALLILCSVFLDYEGVSEGAGASIPDQCVEELENELFALGEEDALSSALNAAWLLAGGLGLPLPRRRARLWSVSGMLYALKRFSYPNAAAMGCDEAGLKMGDKSLSCRMSKSYTLPSELREFSEDIYVYDPPASHGHDNNTYARNPTTVVLYTWADAHPRLVNKYYQGYRELYPSAKIVIVMAKTMKTFFAGRSTNMANVKEVVIKELWPLANSAPTIPSGSERGIRRRGNSQPRVLMHAFSNSGGVNLEACTLVWHSLQRSMGQPIGPMPIQGLILDSTPGGDSFTREAFRWTAGVAMGFAFLPKFLAKIVAAIIVLLRFGLPNLLGLEVLPARGRRIFNTPEYIPTSSARLYIYSDSDPLIGERDVESHAREAEAKGYRRIELDKFSGSGHVAHMRQDPKRYWSLVSSFWDDCCM